MAQPTNTQFAMAVHVLAYLAGDSQGPVSSAELSTSSNANPVHVRRVLAPLRNAGLVRSRPGPCGGWELTRAASTIRLDEVWTIVNGADRVIGLHEPNSRCAVGAAARAVLVDIDRDVERAVRAQLGRRTVRDVLASAAGRRR